MFEENFASIHERLISTIDITQTVGMLATTENKTGFKKGENMQHWQQQMKAKAFII